LDLTAEVAKTLVSVPESDWTPAVEPVKFFV